MTRIDKALDSVRDQSNKKTVHSVPTQSGNLPEGDEDFDCTDVFESVARKVKFNDELLYRNRIITSNMDPSAQTSYKMLRTRILQRMKSNGWRNLAVTSAAQGDGKTVTAINLALSLAGDVNHQICLVDMDLRHSSITDYLGLTIKNGISDCLQRDLPLSEAILGTDLERLLILPNIRTVTNSSEILSSPKMHNIAQQLGHGKNRIVVYDMPPVLAADDMLAFAPIVDAILLVVAEGKTVRTDVMRAYELLEDLDIIGTVLNRSDERTASYY